MGAFWGPTIFQNASFLNGGLPLQGPTCLAINIVSPWPCKEGQLDLPLTTKNKQSIHVYIYIHRKLRILSLQVELWLEEHYLNPDKTDLLALSL